MIRRNKMLESFEKEELKKPPAGYLVQLKIFEALFNEAKTLGIFPLKNPLDGIEADIRLAGILNVRKSS